MSASNPVPPRISVVIVSYNTCALLRRCLQSVTHRSLRLQTIVIDNASTDNSVAMVREEFPGVEVIANDTNLGFAAATNQGLLAADECCDFVLLLNPDAYLCDGALDQLVAFLHEHPRVGVAAPRLLYPDGQIQPAAFHFPTLLMAFFDIVPPRGPLFGRLYRSPLNGRYPEEEEDQPFPIDHPLGAAMLIRAETLREIGLLDEGYWLYAEEVDWCMRCRQVGWAIWQVPAARAVHVAGASASQFRGRSFVALHRARARFVAKWHPPSYRRRYSRLIRLGMVYLSFQAWRAWWRGVITHDELRARLAAYGAVFRLAAGRHISIS